MLEYIQKNIVKQTEKVISALKEKDAVALKEISNHTLHSASVYQDQSSLTFALSVYSISKIVERCGDMKECAAFIEKAIKQLEASKDFLLNNDIDKYKRERDSLLKLISTMDRKFSSYIEEVLDKAKMIKGSKIYGHGISISRVAELLGISQWELMDYVGKTNVSEYKAPAVGIKERVAFTRKIFDMVGK